MEQLCIRIPATATAKYLTSQELPVSNYYPEEAPKYCFFLSGSFPKGCSFCQQKTAGVIIQKVFICLDHKGLAQDSQGKRGFLHLFKKIYFHFNDLLSSKYLEMLYVSFRKNKKKLKKTRIWLATADLSHSYQNNLPQ